MSSQEVEALALARELGLAAPAIAPAARQAWGQALADAVAGLTGRGGVCSLLRRALRLPGLAIALPPDVVVRALIERLLPAAEAAPPPRLLTCSPPRLVSFVVPCFNQSAFLADALASCRAAYDGPIEVVVVDDGSTDPATPGAIAAACAETGVDAKVVRTANCGLADARNTGLDASTGDFVQFLDADDLLVPGKVTRQIAHLADDDGADVSVCDHYVIDGPRSICTPRRSLPPGPMPTLDDFVRRWERGLSIPIHAALFRRRALGSGTPFAPGCRSKEDWIFWTDLAARGVRIHHLPHPLAAYRVHGSNMTRAATSGLRWLAATATIAGRHPGHADAVLRDGIRWFRRFYLPLLAPPARRAGTPGAAAFAPAIWRGEVQAARAQQAIIAMARRGGRVAADASRLATAALEALADAPLRPVVHRSEWQVAPVAGEPDLLLPQRRLADGLTACLVPARLPAVAIDALRRSTGRFDLMLCASPQGWLALLGYAPCAGGLRLVDAPLHA